VLCGGESGTLEDLLNESRNVQHFKKPGRFFLLLKLECGFSVGRVEDTCGKAQ
jgi:hypothetical protein